jgi:hypothetical protein
VIAWRNSLISVRQSAPSLPIHARAEFFSCYRRQAPTTYPSRWQVRRSTDSVSSASVLKTARVHVVLRLGIKAALAEAALERDRERVFEEMAREYRALKAAAADV